MKKSIKFLTVILLSSVTALNAQIYQWAYGFTTPVTNGGISNKVLIDYTSSDIYNVGRFTTNGTNGTDFDPSAGTNTLVTQANNANGFVSKYTSAGAAVLALVFKGGVNEVLDIAVDISDNMYVTGYYSGIVDFDPSSSTSFTLPNTATNDVFVAKINANGTFGWAKRIGGSGLDGGQSIALDASNNVFVGGYFSNTVDFDPGVGTTTLSAINSDAFIVKLDNAGNFLNVTRIGNINQDAIRSIMIDNNNDLYACGYYSSPAAFTGAPFYGMQDAFLGKFSTANLSSTWIKGFGGTEDDTPIELAEDGIGGIYCTGYFKGTADFDPNAGVTSFTSPSITDIDGFVLKFTTAGNLTWARQITGAGSQAPQAINIDNLGDIYVGGFFQGVTDFNPGVAQSLYSNVGTTEDMFVLKLNPSGNYIQTHVMGSTGNERCLGLAVEPNTGFYVITGQLNDAVSVDFNPSGTINNVLGDWYLAKYTKCNYPASPTSATTPTICVGSSATLTVPVGPYATNWYTTVGSTTTYSTGSSIISPTISGNTTMYVDNTNSCGTSGRTPITIIADNQFLSATLSSSAICQGESVVVTAGGAQSYNFGAGYFIANTYTTPSYPNTGSWSSTFSGMNSNGCIQTYSYVVQVNPVPVVSIASSTVSGLFCSNTVNSATYTAAGTATSYTWLPGNVTGSTAVVNFPTTPGVYSLTLIGSNASGCKATITNGSYSVYPAPSVSVTTSNTIICAGNSVTLSAQGATTYTWLPGNISGSTFSASPISTTTYTLIGAISNGCRDSAILTQSVSACTGIENLYTAENDIVLYPNPTNGLFKIKCNGELNLSITDVVGHVIEYKTILPGENHIDISSYPNGIYFVYLKGSNTKHTIKVIKY